jgi:CHAT domain-containing protein
MHYRKLTLVILILFSTTSLIAQQYEELFNDFRTCLKAGQPKECVEEVDRLLAFLESKEDWKSYLRHFVNKEFRVFQLPLKEIESKLLDKSRQLENKTEIAVPLASTYAYLLGIAYGQQDFKTAEYFGLKALERLANSPDSAYAIKENITHSLSNIYLWSLGQPKEALDYAKQSLEYAELAYGREHERTVHTTGNLAIVYNIIGAQSDALDYYKRAINIAEGLPENTDLIIAKSRLYQNTAMLDEETNSLEYLEEALKLLQKIDVKSEIADLQARIGNYQIKANQLDQAKQSFKESLKYIDLHHDQTVILSTKSNIYQGYAEIAFRNKDYAQVDANVRKALDVFKQAYPNGRINHISTIYHNMGVLWKEKDLDKSIAYYKKAIISNTADLSITEFEQNPENCMNSTLFNHNQMMGVLNSYANALLIKYKRDQNLADLKTALQSVNALVKIGYRNMERLSTAQDQLSLLNSLYENFALGTNIAYELYAETKELEYMETAFLFCESNKSFLLQQSLNHEQALKQSQVPKELITEEYQLKSRLSQLEQERIYSYQDSSRMESLTEEIFKQKEALKKLYSRLKKDYPKYYSLAYQNDKIQLSEVSQYLEEDELLLEYFMTEKLLFLFTIAANGEQNFFRIPLGKDFLQKLNLFHQNLSDFSFLKKEGQAILDNYIDQAVDIYESLIPDQVQLSNYSKLRIIPDAQLNFIPFEALIPSQPKNNPDNFKDLDYLIKRYAISYAYSSSLLQELDQIAAYEVEEAILGIAAAYHQEKIDYQGIQGDQLSRLRANLQDIPAAQKEVDFLKQNFRGKFLFGTDANEKDFKKLAANYSIIHLAMHGILNQENPSNSALAFSEDGLQEEDNFLHVYELMQMNLNAELVVLSACETGFGKFEQGEGIMSLARAFMYTGSKSLLMSLWQVNDQSTAELMKSFYQNLANGQTKAVALQQAKIDYLERTNDIAAHPAFWAAFVQIGETSSIQINNNSSNILIYLLISLGGLLVLFVFFFIKSKKSHPKSSQF